ncbi:hypothetical protein DAT300_15920 [Streptococcus suis]|nr:hypothetical protein DAT300_15920 [Streptococcus suis]
MLPPVVRALNGQSRQSLELYFLLFVKSIKVFDEKYFEFNSQNKEIVLFWTKF